MSFHKTCSFQEWLAVYKSVKIPDLNDIISEHTCNPVLMWKYDVNRNKCYSTRCEECFKYLKINGPLSKKDKDNAVYYSGSREKFLENRNILYNHYYKKYKYDYEEYRKENYNNYINSDRWKEKRNEIMDAYNGICQICADRAVHVHHLSYKNFTCESFDELLPLCLECHQQMHPDKIISNEQMYG